MQVIDIVLLLWPGALGTPLADVIAGAMHCVPPMMFPPGQRVPRIQENICQES